MTLSVVTPPAAEPITTDQAKAHLVVGTADDDALIDRCIASARRLAEVRTRRQLMPATYTLKIDRFTDTIPLPRPPLQSVTSVKYIDQDGVQQTLATSVYDVEADAVPGVIRLAYDQSWPDVRAQPEPIEIEFVAGYADAASVPENIINWMLLRIGSMYEHREADVVGTITSAHDFTDSLIEASAVPRLA